MYLCELEKIRLHQILQQTYFLDVENCADHTESARLQYPNANFAEFTFPDLIYVRPDFGIVFSSSR